MNNLLKIKQDLAMATSNLIDCLKIKNKNDIFFVGCSTSEINGFAIGSESDLDVALAVYEGINDVVLKNGLFLAAGCCEHLNRAVVIEREPAYIHNLEIVNAIPQIKAGGAFATVCYNRFSDPVCVENVSAVCGMDIGGTLIGMNLKPVAVPEKVCVSKIGEANLVCARTRPKFTGGSRTLYDENLY